MKPSTRQELIEYCLRSLGAPVLEINVDDDQIQDRIDEAIQFYQDYHSDAVIQNYRKHIVTVSDVSNRYIEIPENFLSISRILPLRTSGGGADAIFDINWHVALDTVFNMNHGGLISYDMTQSYLTTLNMMFSGATPTKFNRHMNRLFIEADWGTEIKEGDTILADGYETVDPNSYPDVYNDWFLKRYATQLIKRQWATNLSKFEGMQLPGGVTINSSKIYDEAIQEIQKLEEEMEMKHSLPVNFFVG